MTAQKQSKHTPKAGSRTKSAEVSSAERPTARSMNYWPGVTSQDVMMKFLSAAVDGVKDVLSRIASAQLVNGTIFAGERAVDVMICTTPGGSAWRFTERDTSRSGAPR
jgi:hypothetical protein